MKKNISINISGIIFHIEEDGYENLKRYLDSINRYFSTFEDSSEILADIESRIAEIFLSKLHDEKQVITNEDVNALMATMGSVNDFRAAEESTEQDPDTGPEAGPQTTYTPPRQLYRDQRRKILGGVCAGLGNYFNVDPLWFRLLFAALLFAGGFTLLVYALMWIIIPGSYTLEEPELRKKMFRDPESRIIGGVSGGVAAYFGADIVLIRLLFIILTITGGLGIILYLILWVCLPEARTITDKMQMQGEPVTLSNIESTIKRNLNIREGDSENLMTKILLFPFRVIGALLSALARIIEPLGDVIRILVGVIIILAGLSLVFGIVVTAGVLLGLFTGGVIPAPWFYGIHLPVDVFTRAFPAWVALAGVVALLVPSLFVILLGASVIAKKIVFRPAAGWALFAIFFISVAMLAVGIPRIAYAFHEDGEYQVERTYQVTGKTAVMKVTHGDSDYDAVRLTLRGHEGPDFKLVQRFESRGSSRSQAVENAHMVAYNFSFQDSIFTFEDELKFKEDAVFRAQRLDMTLYIPYDFPFTMDYGFSRFISQYVDREYANGHTWKMTRNGLECLDCGHDPESTTADLRNFQAVEVTGRFDIRIVQDDHYSVEVTGSDEARNQYDIDVVDETLTIDYEDSGLDWQSGDLPIAKMDLTITLPELEQLEANGMGTIHLDGIRGSHLDIEARGPVNIRGRVDVEDLTLRLTGKSDADLSGSAENMNARIEFASRLRAYELEARNAFIEAGGASSARVHVTETLEIDEGVASDVDFRGQPRSVRHRSVGD